jgi:hypothetical protein
MKKIMYAFILISLIFPLAACSTSAASTASAPSDSLSQEGQLLLGTLKLDSTDVAVNVDQAAVLLPLWETLQSMAVSGTSAAAEVDALVAQIQASMTSEQMAAITTMNLASTDLAAAVAEYKASSAATTSGNSSSAGLPQMTTGSGGPMAAPAGGNPPTDMGVGPMSANGSTSGMDIAQAASTPSSGAQSSTNTVQIPANLIGALVQQLQKTIAGAK